VINLNTILPSPFQSFWFQRGVAHKSLSKQYLRIQSVPQREHNQWSLQTFLKLFNKISQINHKYRMQSYW
jgi:hypothetical protein